MARKSKEPTCAACGVSWVDHKGIMAICAENAELKRRLQTIGKAIIRTCSEATRTAAQLHRAREENKLLRQSLGIQRLLRAISKPEMRISRAVLPRRP